MAKKHNWLAYALVTMVTWGIWGAFSDYPDYPATLTYVVWAISMIPCALVALANIRFKLDVRKKSVLLGLGVGLLGAAGQLLLFEALKYGPAYIIFPMISVAPIVTVILSTVFLKERVSRLGVLGIVLAFVALVCFSLSGKTDEAVKGNLWILLASLVFIFWGIQAFVMKVANNYTPDAESIFVYMAISAVLLIPVALLMTDFSQPINHSFNGPYLTFFVQILNAIGALTLVYANRYGKAMIVAPLGDACAPVITVAISLVLYSHLPSLPQVIGIVAAIACVLIFSRE
ncbi:MAG: EamA family transporter [Bacteroidales bacterium]|nr:EamA family transporter [Bacteroidales bacterium]MCR5245051.1 DMT family transporter [Bacteroidales bacterium]